MVTINSISAIPAEEVIEPVTIDEVKSWARIDDEDSDDIIYTAIIGAREDIELETNLKLVEHTVTMNISGSGRVGFVYGTPSEIVIKSVDSDWNETAETLDDDYKLIGSEAYLYECSDYIITYKVGGNVSQGLKEAIMMLVAYRYNNRGDQEKQQGMPEDILRKVSTYKAVYI